VIVQRLANGTEKPIFRRFLNPESVAGDRGIQSLDIPVPNEAADEIVFRTLPGPSNNASYDWSYWGRIKIQ
jgi:hypothetical protein